ncbi:MAG: deoxyribodipyrimidine photolyase [Spirochaetaceae bacterium]|nr:MAG: deoxyribodipyrimidine photolyase [Spirochaetaceae bacterium]
MRSRACTRRCRPWPHGEGSVSDAAFASRITELNDALPRAGAYVLYWMQNSQRTRCNHALEYAIGRANELRVPALVCFAVTPDYPDASERHYRFMIEGLADVAAGLKRRGVAFVVRFGDPPAVALDVGRDASLIVCDRGYLRHLRQWRFDVARTARCPVVEVETDLAVPVEAASSKREYAARTIRPRIHRRLAEHLVMPDQIDPDHLLDPVPAGVDVGDVDAVIGRVSADVYPGPVSRFFRGGESAAWSRFERFRDSALERYEEQRSEPASGVASGLSPYLHFGQISDLEIAIELGAHEFVAGLEQGKGRMSNQPGSVGMRTDSATLASSRDAFLEELLVRRGLAFNYVWYTPNYDRYEALPDWARGTLDDHRGDERPACYTQEQLEAARTHDEYWNAAMTEMKVTGSMQNYMRMYWGKKILEWSKSPEHGFETTLALNNRFFVDGRDPNSYANVGWIYGLHDRPWTERDVFGKVRYMNAKGLERKFDMAAYRLKVDELTRRE